MIGSWVMSTPAKSRPRLTISRSASSVRLRGTTVTSRKIPEPPGPDAAALVDLDLLGARDHVARGQLHLVGSRFLHEAFAVGVEQVRPLAAGALGDQDPGLDQAGGVVLDHLHVHQRRARPVGHRDPVAGHDQPVRGRLVDLSGPAAGEDHVLGGERFEAGRCARHGPSTPQQRPASSLSSEVVNHSSKRSTVSWCFISCS